MMIMIGVCFAVPLCLFISAKLYFRAIYNLKLQNTNASKVSMFLLWIVACGIIFLSVYVPIIAARQSVPEIEPILSLFPLILGTLSIGIFQKTEIKKLRNILNEKK